MNESLRQAIAREFQPARLERLTRDIAAIEKTFCYRRFAESARYCYEQMREAGLADVQLIELPADGATTHMDFTMPQAWDVEDASLEIIEPAGGAVPLVDYPAMPLCVANRCAPTPPGGIIAEVITAQQLRAADNAGGAFVYTEGQHPQTLRFEAVAKGAVGLISDCSPAREIAPNETYWINGWCSPGWYETREHMPLTCYSISPSMGKLLGERLQRGAVRVRASVRSRLYDGSIHTVTGLLPGKEEREIVLLAHIYEPFPCDDAVGAASLIEIGRSLAALISQGALRPLNVGVRLLISMERYGFAAYFQDEGVRRRSLLGISMDCVSLSPTRTGEPVEVRYSPASMPFWGDLLLWRMANEELGGRPLAAQYGNLSDDTFISDLTIGVPSQWVWTRVGATHHSSLWFREEMNDWALGADIARLIAGYVASLATADRQDAEQFRDMTLQGLVEEARSRQREWGEAVAQGKLSAQDVRQQARFLLEWGAGRARSLARTFPSVDAGPILGQIVALGEELIAQFPCSPLLAEQTLSSAAREAAGMAPRRATLGMPFSQARIPLDERMPGGFEQALNWADGARNLWEIAQCVQCETGVATQDAWLERFIRYCRLMERYGYLEIR